MNPYATLAELSSALTSGEVSSVELTDAYLDRIEALDGRIGAYITVTAEQAREQAKLADVTRRQGNAGPLTGVPIAIKDLLCTKGILTTCASRILDNFRPPYDATAITKLREAGAVMLGKTNMDEFAMGSSCEHSAFKQTRNPWNTDLIPGGSSGGSAAAVAAGLAPASLGTDTGGSIRQPGALCGVVGMKPTYGRVSRYGLIAFASSLDQIGPFTRTVEDSAILCNAICGHDTLDSTSANEPVPDFTSALGQDLKGLRVGMPKEYFIEGIDPEVESAVRAAIDQLGSLGAEIVEISLPHTEYAVAVYYIVAVAEASSNLARYDGVQYGHRATDTKNIIEMFTRTRSEGFGPEVQRRIMLGTYALSAGFYDAYYLKAQKVRSLIKQDFDAAFEKCDVIATPTSPGPAFRAGEKLDDPLQMYLCDIFTIPCNLAGIPGMSLPCGFTQAGLPIGLQLLAPAFDEVTMFRTGHAYERANDFFKQSPNL